MDVLYVVCQEQAEEANVTDEQFGRAMAGGFGGGDTSPNTDSWDRANDDDSALGCTIDIVTRVIYGDDYKEYGFYRRFEIDSVGGIRKIGPETKYTIQS